MELDKHVPVHVLDPKHQEYHTPLDDDIQVEDDDEDPEEDLNEEHEPKDSDETEPFEEDETAALIDAFAARSSPFPLASTRPAYDQAPLGHRATMIRMRDDIPKEDMPSRRRFILTAPPPRCDITESSAVARAPRSQYDFVDIVEAGHGLIRSPGHDTHTIAKAADKAEDTDRRDIRLEIDVVRGQRTAYEIEVQERQGTEDLVVTQMMRIHTLEARARTDMVEDAGKIKKLEIELWNIRVKGNDVAAYTLHFQELALMCTKFLADETEKVDKYISRLPDNTYENVMSVRPKTLDETIELANDLMDQKLCTYAKRQNDNKRKTDDSSRNSQQQQPHKKQNVARAYTAGPGEKKVYTGDLPLCTKCN
nr:reverse transcriptase domain-containing protein [Tanacetum cinerariifolium]